MLFTGRIKGHLKRRRGGGEESPRKECAAMLRLFGDAHGRIYKFYAVRRLDITGKWEKKTRRGKKGKGRAETVRNLQHACSLQFAGTEEICNSAVS